MKPQFEKNQFIRQMSLVILALLLTLSVAGCGSGALVGKWKTANAQNGDTLEFFQDGTVISTSVIGLQISGTYKIVDSSHLRIEMGGLFGLAGAQVYEYSIAGDRLNMSIMGFKSEYQRVR